MSKPGKAVIRDNSFFHNNALVDTSDKRKKIHRDPIEGVFSIFNNIKQGYSIGQVIFDSSGTAVDFRFLEVNRIFEKMVGTNYHAGITAKELFPHFEKGWIDFLGDIVHQQKSGNYESWIINHTGIEWYNIHAFPISSSSENMVAMLIESITENKKHESDTAFIVDICRDFSRLSILTDIGQIVCEKLSAYLGLTCCMFIETDLQNNDLIICNAWHREGLITADKFPINSFFNKSTLDSLLSGQSQYEENIESIIQQKISEHLSIHAAAFFAIPFITNGHFSHMLCLYSSKPREWIKELDFLRNFGDRFMLRLQRAISEDALAESEEKFRSLFNSVDAGFCIIEMIFDNHGRPADILVLESNPALEKVLGFKKLTGQTVRKINPDLEDSWIELFGQVSITGETFSLEVKLSRFNRWINITASKIGKTSSRQMALVFEDISERKFAEISLLDYHAQLEKEVNKRLKEISEKNQLIHEISLVTPDIITIHDAATNKILYANHNAIWKDTIDDDTVFNLEEEKRTVLLVHPDDHQKAAEFLVKRRMLKDDEILEIDLRNQLPDHEWGWFRVRSKVFKRDKNGEASQIISFTSNTTENKKAEQAINEQNHFIKHITETIPDIMYVYDLESKNTVFVNKGIFNTLGFSESIVTDEQATIFLSLIHPDDLNRRIMQLNRLSSLKIGEIREMEMRIKDSNGKYNWFNIRDNVFKTNEAGNVIQVLGIGQDITSKKEAEEAFNVERSHNLELRRMNELMDTFVSAAAHDLKAPVSNMKLLTNVIENTRDEAFKLELQKKYSPIIETLENTISGLIRVLSIEKDSSSNIKDIVLSDTLKTILAELSEKINIVRPKFRVNFDQCPAITYIDTYLLSIFRNLISNSLKYRLPDRELVIDITSSLDNNYVVITFMDNGRGIDLDMYGNELFKPFKRFSEDSEGSGLGLHLVKSILTKNGGKIEVESRPCSGTTFKAYLVEYKTKQ